jgi:hypothetical protein
MKKFVLVLVVLAGVLVPSHANAATKPPPPQCGATITSDIRLTQDMTCAGTALRVTPGVTVDLGRHTITITNPGTCSPQFFCAGAITDGPLLSPFQLPITVTNGTLRGAGVNAHANVDRVKFENARSIAFGGSFTRSRFTSSDLTLMSTGVVDHNRFIDSSIGVDTALFGFGSGFAITNNRIERGRIGMSIEFGAGALAGQVSGNRVRNSPSNGLAMSFEADAVTDLAISNNRVMYSAGDGISVTRTALPTPTAGHRVTLSGNVANTNAGAGIRVSETGAPATIVDGGGNVARRNGAPCVGIVCLGNNPT